MVVSSAAKKYRKSASELAHAAGLRPLAGPVVVRLAVYRPSRRGDLDNSLKIILDSLRGVAYHDDAQIVRIEASRFDAKHNPRVELQVEAVKTPERQHGLWEASE